MTAQRRPAVRKSEPESGGWPGVVRYALDDWPRTARLCVIVVVAGAVLLLALRLGLRFWVLSPACWEPGAEVKAVRTARPGSARYLASG